MDDFLGRNMNVGLGGDKVAVLPGRGEVDVISGRDEEEPIFLNSTLARSIVVPDRRMVYICGFLGSSQSELILTQEV